MKQPRSGLVALVMLVLAAAALAGCLGGREEVATPPAQPATIGALAPQTVTMFVGPEMVDCPAAAATRCLEVRYGPGEAYQAFGDPIEGFSFQPGVEYQLVVERTAVTGTATSAASYRYRLMQIVSEVPVAPTRGTAALQLEGTSWSLVSLMSAGGQMVDALPEAGITALFVENNVAGSAGCNSYNAAYKVDGDKLTIEPAATTRMSCPEPSATQERAYLADLVSAASYKIEDAALLLVNADGTTVATFSAPVGAASTSPELTGVVWEWTDSQYANDTSTSVDDPTKYTIEFKGGGDVSIVADCNSAAGTYTPSDGQLTILVGATTLAVCAGDSLSEKFIGELGDVVTYVIPETGKLVLNMKMDAGNMSFAAAGR